MSPHKLLALAALVVATQASAQQIPTTGTLVIVPANGEVTAPNDMATATFMVEEQHKDKSVAASRVNAKMREGTAIIKSADPRAELKTYGYYTFPVYPEDRPPQPMNAVPKQPAPVAWRVGQYLQVKTTNLATLEKTVAAAQRVVALNGLNFHLSPQAQKKLDAERIAATYKNLNERVAAIAAAMGRNVNDAVLDTVDFEGSGNYAGDAAAAAPQMMMMERAQAKSAQVEEPTFEPGDTTLNMRLVGKVRFK
ncbi:SIMPL domain-containing protein [Pseudoduganella sp. GCM10020061]|uniref:SIMPL domain-containing protein n=1 Tax=Pseudoduganella sp. GCM10020061 TaxID=3317345 RepID=UPI00363AE0CD